jgi:hypothetical protein
MSMTPLASRSSAPGDHLAHLVRDNADVFNIEHVFMKAL